MTAADESAELVSARYASGSNDPTWSAAPSGTHVGAAEEASSERPLCRRALSVERDARQRPVDPEPAATLWSALLEGRWKVIERLRVDGRRLIVAERNELGAHRAQALTEPECRVAKLLYSSHSAKRIAQELRLTETAVSRLTQSALSKLGMRSRAEWIELCSVIGQSVIGQSAIAQDASESRTHTD